MKITKKKKPIVGNLYEPTLQIPGQSSYLSNQASGTYDKLAWDSLVTPMTGVNVSNGPDMAKILAGAPSKFASINSGSKASGLNPIGAMPGVMGLINSSVKDFDHSGIGKEVVGINDMSRNDILNTNVDVDAQQKGFGAIAGDAASAAMTGMQVAGPLGALAGLVPIATGIFGNKAKQDKAEQAEQQWTNNLEAKNKQLQDQDLRQNMVNFSANGGDLFAYGGQMKSQLTEYFIGKHYDLDEKTIKKLIDSGYEIEYV